VSSRRPQLKPVTLTEGDYVKHLKAPGTVGEIVGRTGRLGLDRTPKRNFMFRIKWYEGATGFPSGAMTYIRPQFLEKLTPMEMVSAVSWDIEENDDD